MGPPYSPSTPDGNTPRASAGLRRCPLRAGGRACVPLTIQVARALQAAAVQLVYPFRVPPCPASAQILEYHHRRTKSSLLHPQLPALHRVSPSMTASASLAANSMSLEPGGSSRPGTPSSSGGGGGGGGGKQGSFGRRLGMFELMVKSQSAAWAEGGPLAALGDSAAGGATGGVASRAPSFAEGRSGLGSRQSSLSQRGSGGVQGAAARRCVVAMRCGECLTLESWKAGRLPCPPCTHATLALQDLQWHTSSLQT